MTFQIFVQHQPDQDYVASVVGIPNCVAEGETKEEAIAKAKEVLNQLLSQGELVTVEIDNGGRSSENPWLALYGRFKDDPTYDDFLAAIEDYRRELDEEEAAREGAAMREEAA
jgi:predicted RNase H-like HicB family nuclease